MRTVRSSGRLSRGGGGCLLGGVVSQHALRQTLPVDRHTPNHFVADGKNK